MNTLYLDISQESSLSAIRHLTDFVAKSNTLFSLDSIITWTTLDGEHWETNPGHGTITIDGKNLIIEDEEHNGTCYYDMSQTVPMVDIATIKHNY